MLRVVISGSTGLVGSRIVELLSDDFSFIPLFQDDVNITNKDVVWNFLKDKDFDLFLHLAAYTNVDGAESEKDLARKINVDGTRNVFEAAKEKKARFIYISTGFVFDGKQPPYFEDSVPNPLGYYAKTKHEGEKVVNSDGMIVRIDTPYRVYYEQRKDFVRTIKSLLEEKKELKMISDSLLTPTFIDDLSFALKHLLQNFSTEIYHIAGADSVAPYEAGRLIAKTFGLDENLIKKASFDDFLKNRAPRPQFLEMKSKKNTFYKMKTFEEGLLEIKNQLKYHVSL